MIVSPLSVSSALALLSQGAGGKTYEQLKQTLHLGNDKSAVANQYCEHRKALEKNAEEATLSIANRVYVQQGNQLSKTFQEIATLKFKSGFESLNFAESKKKCQHHQPFRGREYKRKNQGIIKTGSIRCRYSISFGECHLFQWKVENPVRQK